MHDVIHALLGEKVSMHTQSVAYDTDSSVLSNYEQLKRCRSHIHKSKVPRYKIKRRRMHKVVKTLNAVYQFKS